VSRNAGVRIPRPAASDPCPQRLCPNIPASYSIQTHSARPAIAPRRPQISCHAHPRLTHQRNGTQTSARPIDVPRTPAPSLAKPLATHLYLRPSRNLSNTPSTHCRGGIAPPSWVFDRTPKSQKTEGCPTLRAFCEGWALTSNVTSLLSILSILFFCELVPPPPCLCGNSSLSFHPKTKTQAPPISTWDPHSPHNLSS